MGTGKMLTHLPESGNLKLKTSSSRQTHPAQSGIEAVQFDEFFMGALLDDCAFFQNIDTVGIAHGAEAVGGQTGCVRT